MLAQWPGVTQGGTTTDHPIIIEDFFTSLLEMAKIENPTLVQEIDGESFLPILKGSTPSTHPLYWHYPNEWGPDGPGIGSFSAVREGDWKLIYFHLDQYFELYHLKEDISERQNLVSTQKEKVNQLVYLLDTYLQDVKAQMPFNKDSKQVIPYPMKAYKAQKL